jgi:hypothetical protein
MPSDIFRMDQQRPSHQQQPSLCFLGAALLVMAFNAWYFVDFQERTATDGQHQIRSVDTSAANDSPLASRGNAIEIALLLSFPNSVRVTRRVAS